jgi:hypothetical protein
LSPGKIFWHHTHTRGNSTFRNILSLHGSVCCTYITQVLIPQSRTVYVHGPYLCLKQQTMVYIFVSSSSVFSKQCQSKQTIVVIIINKFYSSSCPGGITLNQWQSLEFWIFTYHVYYILFISKEATVTTERISGKIDDNWYCTIHIFYNVVRNCLYWIIW